MSKAKQTENGGLNNDASAKLLSSFKKLFCSNPGLTLGFTLFWLWIWLIFQSVLFESVFSSAFGLKLPPWIISLGAYAFTFFILGALFKYKSFAPHWKHYLKVVSTVMSLGALFGIFLTYSSTGSQVLDEILSCAAGILMGSGSAMLHMEWGRLMGFLGTQKTIFYGVISTVGAAICLFLLSFIPQLGVQMCAFCLPPLSIAFLSKQFKRTPQALRESKNTRLYVPWKFLITSFIQGLSFGIFLVLLLIGSADWPALPLSSASFATAALVVFIIVIFYKLDFNQLFYQVGFFLMALGYLIFVIVGTQNIAGWFIQSVGYRIVDILMWALCAYLIKQKNLPTNWVFAWTTCALLLGQTIGALIGNIVFSYAIPTPQGAYILSASMVFVLLGSALLLFNDKNIRAGWGMVKPTDEEAGISLFEISCHFISSEHNLTARETEVFALLAKGRNNKFICEELTLSKETIKTHVKNIYRKLEIHSQQEAMTLIEAQEKNFPQGEKDE